MTRRALAALAAAGLLPALAGCASGADFVRDDSLVLTSPAALSEVDPPFDVSWQGRRAKGAQFAVFVDRAPIAPGRPLRDVAVADNDDACTSRAGCPDKAWLEQHDVYLTTEQSVRVTQLSPPGGVDGSARHPVHTATVVLVDESGHRIGSESWAVEFRD